MKQIPLLPHYFKWIAIALVVLTIPLGILLKDYLAPYGEDSKNIGTNLMNLGLFLYFFS